MAPAKKLDFTKTRISRRNFVSSAITVAGGTAMFSFPDKALASEKPTAENIIPAKTAFVDSLERSVNVAKPANSVVPLGIYAQTLMETLYPNALASLAKEVSGDANDFKKAGLSNIVGLVETGTSKADYGKDVNFSQIAALAPDIILQAGIPRAGTIEEMEQIQSETGVPCVFLDISFGRLQGSYRSLGCLLGCERRAEELACYIENAQIKATAAMSGNDSRPKVFYAPRVAGKKVTAGVAVQVDVMSQLGLEPVTRPYNFAARTVDFAALNEENPDFILFDDISFPQAFFSCEGEVYELWKDIRAIGENRFSIAPSLMHNILGSAVFAQSIGMLWMAYATAPQNRDIDMPSELQKFYEIFYDMQRDESAMAMSLGEI